VLRALTASDAELGSWSTVEEILLNPVEGAKAGLCLVGRAKTEPAEHSQGKKGQQQQQQQEVQEQQHPAVIERFSHEVPVPLFSASHAQSSTRRDRQGAGEVGASDWEERVLVQQHGTTYVWTRSMVSRALHPILWERPGRKSYAC